MGRFLKNVSTSILPRGLLLPCALALMLASPPAQAGSGGRYNDWELWSSAANAVLPAKRGQQGPFRLNAALGVVSAPEYLGSDTIATKPLPLLDVNYRGSLFLSTQQGIGWNAWRKRTLRAGPRITFDFGRAAGDSPRLAGLPDIEIGTELGLFVESFISSWRFKGDIRKEIGGGHAGLLLNGEAAWGSRWSKNASLIMGMRATFMDDTYAESYFSVAAANATATRTVYTAASGFRDFNAYFQIVYDFNQAFYVATELRGTALMEQAADSPLAEVDAFVTGSLMLGYRF